VVEDELGEAGRRLIVTSTDGSHKVLCPD
jgi:hypothetical protein